MPEKVEVRLLGGFSVTKGETIYESIPRRTKKGAALMTYLILQRGQPVPTPRLIREVWGRRQSVNPENALKTMVSRLRMVLAEISPQLSACLVSGQGTYRWECQPGVTVDVLDVLELDERMRGQIPDEDRELCCQRLLERYGGDLYQPDDMLNASMATSRLHRIYLETALSLIELKRKREAWNDILQICEAALRIDDMDEPLQIEQMRALVYLNRMDEAHSRYHEVTIRDRRLLDAEPSEEFQSFYRQLTRAGTRLRYNLDLLRNRLTEPAGTAPGPFFCEMKAFREFYRIQMRNLERLGSTMFLGLIMLGDGEPEGMDTVIYEGAMAALLEILRKNLRRGDIVTRCDEYAVALLLPTVNYQSGTMVMERIEHVFYTAYPRERVPFHARITPLGGEK